MSDAALLLPTPRKKKIEKEKGSGNGASKEAMRGSC